MFLAIVLGVLLFDAIISLAISILDTGYLSSPDAHITQGHFVQPHLPAGFVADFGVGAVAVAALLAVLYIAIALFTVSLLADAEGMERQISVPEPVRFRGTYRAGMAWGLALIFICAAVARMLLSEPVGLKTRYAAALDFMVGFNRAVSLKAKFDEKGYETEMLDALTFNRSDFIWFARSGYWAYYYDERSTRWTDRKSFAADKLYRLSNFGVLSDADLYEGYKLMSEVGDTKRAEEMMGCLEAKAPQTRKTP